MNYNVAFSLPAEDALCDVARVPRGTQLAVVLARLVEMIEYYESTKKEEAGFKVTWETDNIGAVIAQSKLLFCDPCRQLLEDLLRNAGYPPPGHDVPTAESEEASRWLEGKFDVMAKQGKPS
jgi:hypothetical protein